MLAQLSDFRPDASSDTPLYMQFSEELSQRGFTAGSRWLQRDIGVASPQELLSLGLSPNMPVARLKRLRTADDVVMAIETTTIPAAYMPNPHSVTDSLYGYLEAIGAVPMRAFSDYYEFVAESRR